MSKEISMELEIEREEKLYSDDDWCYQQYVSNEWEYGLRECVELEEEGLGEVVYFPCGGWSFHSLEPCGIFEEIHEEIEEEKWEEIFFTREEENMEGTENEWGWGSPYQNPNKK